MNRIKSTTQVGVYDESAYPGIVYYNDPAKKELFYGKGLVDCRAALGYYSPAASAVTEMKGFPGTVGGISITESLRGAHLSYGGKPVTLTLPAGYSWSTTPAVSMTGGFAAATASLTAVAEVLTLTPDYTGATTASAGVITLTGAQVSGPGAGALTEVAVQVAGDSLLSGQSLKVADFPGNHLTGITLTGIPLSPGFNSDTLNYSMDTAASVTTSSMTAVKGYGGATAVMTVNGAAYAGGVPPAGGEQPVDGGCHWAGGTRTYRLSVNRALPATGGPWWWTAAAVRRWSCLLSRQGISPLR